MPYGILGVYLHLDLLMSDNGPIYSDLYAPDIDPNIYPPHVAVKSVHNTVIEAFWEKFQKLKGQTIKKTLIEGAERHIFHSDDPTHM